MVSDGFYAIGASPSDWADLQVEMALISEINRTHQDLTSSDDWKLNFSPNKKKDLVNIYKQKIDKRRSALGVALKLNADDLHSEMRRILENMYVDCGGGKRACRAIRRRVLQVIGRYIVAEANGKVASLPSSFARERALDMVEFDYAWLSGVQIGHSFLIYNGDELQLVSNKDIKDKHQLDVSKITLDQIVAFAVRNKEVANVPNK